VLVYSPTRKRKFLVLAESFSAEAILINFDLFEEAKKP
jgi:hypothetical protein